MSTSSGNSTPSFSIGISNGEMSGYLRYIQAVNKTVINVRLDEKSGPAKAYVTLKYTKTTD